MSSTFVVAVVVAATDDDENVEFKDVCIKYLVLVGICCYDKIL